MTMPQWAKLWKNSMNFFQQKFLKRFDDQRERPSMTSDFRVGRGGPKWPKQIGRYRLQIVGHGHTAGLDTIFVQIIMDALPGVSGVSKNQNFIFTNKTVEFLR